MAHVTGHPYHPIGTVLLMLLMLVLEVVVVRTTDGRADMRPPIITYQLGVPEHAYKDGESVEMKCNANPGSNAVYHWKKDGNPFNTSSSHITRLPDRGGSFTIKSPGAADDGVYQCFASNSYGTAVSVRTKLQKAYLDPFPTVNEALVHRPIVGSSLSLNCRPPRSYPPGYIYWGVGRTHSSQLQSINVSNSRVQLSYEGRLYFANVIPSDGLEYGMAYLCTVFNQVMRALMQGEDQRVQPIVATGHLYFANVINDDSLNDNKYLCIANNPFIGAHVQGHDQKVVPIEVPGSPTYIEPSLMWSSPTRDIAIKGQNKRMKCIFAGLPTPRVSWERIDSARSSRVNETPEGHGTEIEIVNVEFEDAGVYRCLAGNRGTAAQTSHDITLVVQAAPYWRNSRPPGDKQVSEEDDIELDCQADGRPKPEVKWAVNGSSLAELPANPRWSIDGNRIRISKVTTADRGIFQCIASNEHGSILANAVLTVEAIAPGFKETPKDRKIVEGQSTTLTCSVYGSPSPKVTWFKGTPSSSISRSDRFIIHSNGNLEIKGALLDDADMYYCEAKNKFGTDTASCTLTVRSPTLIQPSDVRDIVANATDEVRIPCDVTTDEAERSSLVVEWRKNGVAVRPDGRTILLDPVTFSLTIKRSRVNDSAGYTCHAGNGLDSATSDVIRLTIRDRPEPPRDVRVEHCDTDFIRLTWRPSHDNNSPITEYIIYTTNSASQDPSLPVETTLAAPSSTSIMSSVMPSRPWTSYTFQVVARNALGSSDRSSSASDGKSAVCTTPSAVPEQNPRNICSRLVRPTQLVIVWEPLPTQEQNGPGFYYKVGYRQLSSDKMLYASVTNPNASELVIFDQKNTFQEYEILVQSVNEKGEAPLKNDDRRKGYSGEGKPLDTPQNLKLRPETLNSTYVELSWDPIDTRSERVRGFFRGYQIQYWRAEDQPRDVRKTDVLLGEEVDLCPEYNSWNPSRLRRLAESKQVLGGVADLWPYSVITAGVLVLNQGNEGTLSDTIDFTTPEGIPDAVSSLLVIEQGSSHLTVRWSPPKFPNGIIVCYNLQYQVGPPNVGSLLTINCISPLATTRRILNLEPATVYRISVSATTIIGVGVTTYTEGKTVPASDPDVPAIGKIQVGEDSANVTWFSSAKPPGSNPGAEFYVEYVKVKDLEAGLPWNRSYPEPDVAESGNNWAQVSDLNSGDDYYFRVVAVNGVEPYQRETRSDPPWRERIGTLPGNLPVQGEEGELITSRASASWFIILMCIIAMLLLILILACIVQRSRGQQYPVFEKERIWGHDPNAPEDAPFGEYTRNNEPSDVGRSQVSLDSDDKPIDSETDSMGEYEDQDPSKFNEDGSFIGQYTRRNQQQGGGRGGRSRQGPSSDTYNTFV